MLSRRAQVWLDMAAVLVRQRALADAAKCISQAASAAASHEPDLLCAQGSLAEVCGPSHYEVLQYSSMRFASTLAVLCISWCLHPALPASL